MATWFFGLMHEAGHLRSAAPGAVQLPDSLILEALESALGEWPHHPEALKNEALANARTGNIQYILSLERLRAESQADIFAVSVLFKATLEITRKMKRKFEIDQFIVEMHIILNLIIILERCQRMALAANNPDAQDLAARKEIALHPISYSVRARMMHLYLGLAVASFLFQTDRPSAEQEAKCLRLVNDVSSSTHEAIREVDTGMARAMRFALFPEERSMNLMSQFAHQLMTSKNTVAEIIEADKIFKVADSFGIENDSVRTLQRLVQSRRAQTAGT
jgi:hypothetical protein